jgi:chemotaxis protein MotB
MDDVAQQEAALAAAEQEAERLSLQLSKTREEHALLEKRVEKLKQQREKDARHFAELEDRLKRELNESRIEISQFKDRMTVIKLTSEVLFDSGSAEIQPRGQKVLALIAESLNAYPERAISIEGHTDSVPIGKYSSYDSNWELSTARALAAVDFFRQQMRVDPRRLQVVGHGEFQPVASNQTIKGRQLNRRIEIRLMPEAPIAAEKL